jgi:hypothetical protein
MKILKQKIKIFLTYYEIGIKIIKYITNEIVNNILYCIKKKLNNTNKKQTTKIVTKLHLVTKNDSP